MKKLTWFAGFLVFALTQSAMAQETPRIELFGGYSFLRATTADDAGISIPGAVGNLDGVSANGFMVSMAWNIKKRIGIAGEYSRHSRETNAFNLINPPILPINPNVPSGLVNFRVEGRVNTFLVGPRFTFRTETIEPFGHFLVGASRGSFDIRGTGTSLEDSGTAFTFSAGGGLDIKFNPRIIVRVGQIDYLRTPIPNGTDLNSGRISTGIVYRIGSLK